MSLLLNKALLNNVNSNKMFHSLQLCKQIKEELARMQSGVNISVNFNVSSFLKIIILATHKGMQDLHYLTRDGAHAPCSVNQES